MRVLTHLMTNNSYNIRHNHLITSKLTSPYFFHDGDSLQFRQHIKDNDYFGTLATHISIVRNHLEGQPKNLQKFYKDQIESLEKAEEELVYLQKHYELRRKINQRQRLIG